MLKIGDFAKLAQVSTKTVRHYDKKGLLKPAWIDRFTGYRYYTVSQLAQLNRILALKDLGFSLAQIQQMLSEPLSLDELRGMFRLKHAELARHIAEEQARLERISDRLAQIEQEETLFLSMYSHEKEQHIMEPTIITKPAFTVVGISVVSNNQNQEIPKLWEQFAPRAHEIDAQSGIAYGVCGAMDENNHYPYMAGYEITANGATPDGMERWEISEQTYAIFPCSLDNIGETYEHIFTKWLPQSEYKQADSPDFEYYPAAFNPNSNKEMAIYLPLAKK